jgi:predicted AAA+ superfamily ATPase
LQALLAQPWVGASWEGFVVEQIIGAVGTTGSDAGACFFRTGEGHEIDLVLEHAGERWAIEVKLTASPGPSDLARLDAAADLIDANRRILVSQTPESTGTGDRASCNLAGVLGLLGL